jgi:hypothetical protein
MQIHNTTTNKVQYMASERGENITHKIENVGDLQSRLTQIYTALGYLETGNDGYKPKIAKLEIADSINPEIVKSSLQDLEAKTNAKIVELTKDQGSATPKQIGNRDFRRNGKSDPEAMAKSEERREKKKAEQSTIKQKQDPEFLEPTPMQVLASLLPGHEDFLAILKDDIDLNPRLYSKNTYKKSLEALHRNIAVILYNFNKQNRLNPSLSSFNKIVNIVFELYR